MKDRVDQLPLFRELEFERTETNLVKNLEGTIHLSDSFLVGLVDWIFLEESHTESPGIRSVVWICWLSAYLSKCLKAFSNSILSWS